MRFLLVWLVNTLALVAVAYLLPSVTIASPQAAIIAALVLGLVNAVIRPVLVLLTLPVTVLTLGFFILVINALLFWAVASFVPGFDVAGFWSAFVGALVFSIISFVVSAALLK